MLDFQRIKERLVKIEDYVFFMPLTIEEINALQEEIGTIFPTYYKEFLLNFGFQQDLVQGLFTDKEEFIEQNSYLEEDMSNYLGIGDNGGEGFWMIKTDKEDNQRIYNWVDDEIEKTDFEFIDLIEHSLAVLEVGDVFLLKNSEKSWCVQFAITTADEQRLFSTLGIKPLGEWKYNGVSEAGVDEYSIEIDLNTEVLTMKKLKINNSPTSGYFFNYKENIDSVKQEGKINKWSALLRKDFPEFYLIDYGIFPNDFEM